MPEARLILGDALTVLPTLESESIDAVVTDPPYLLGSSSTRRGDRPQSPIADWTNASRWYRDWLQEVFRITKPSAPVWMFGNWRTLPVLEIAVQSLARRITSTLVWDKQWIGVGSMNGLRCQYELVFLMGGPKFSIEDRAIGDIWPEKWASARPNGHAQEKPVPLASRLLEVSGVPPGGCVLDPFMGSGTVGVACARAGLDFIGIEIESGYLAVAQKRLAAVKDESPPLRGGHPMTRRRRTRAKWRRRLARRLGIVVPPLRKMPAITRQYHTFCRVKRDGGRGKSAVIWCAWPGRFRGE